MKEQATKSNATGVIVALCRSEAKGTTKTAISEARLQAGHGIDGDAHAGDWHRQVSLLAEEQIDQMRAKGLELPPGAFGENVVTRGLDLSAVAVGDRLKVGERIVLEITQRGKECHSRCAIYHRTGDCIMPREGLFARVLEGGTLVAGDSIGIV
jgi:cyclic pyranopterin phosphate synthase